MTDGTHRPTPGPRPGPRPGPTPAAARTPAAPPAPAPEPDPDAWGRVDEAGNVFLRTAEGERQIGSWQAGEPAEALAHYANRYRDLATEVVVLESRLRTHPEEAGRIAGDARTIREGLPTAAVIGDLGALDARLAKVIDAAAGAGERVKRDKAARREKAIARKEALAAEAEQLAEHSTEWKAAGDRIRAILEEWRTIRGIDRRTDDALWKRYARARDAFNRRRGAHFAELDRTRAAAKRAKEELIVEAEALQDSTDWGATAAAYRELMTRWKAAGRAPKDVDDRLWARFKAAQDRFFTARNAVTAQRDREFEANAEAKEALLAEYGPRIRPEEDLDAARAELRALQDKWEAVGFVPRGRVREFESRIAELERRVAEAADARWRRTDPEAQARVAQFESRAAEFAAEAERLAAAGAPEQRIAAARDSAAQWRDWADTARRALEEG